jgi:4-hydroxythreonine-4-phosphate dehydrogenase
MTQLRPLAVSMGEPAGIGGEIALLAWLRRTESIPPFFLIDHAERLARLADRCKWTVPIQTIDHPKQALKCFHDALPVLDHPLPATVFPGQPDPANSQQVAAAIRRGVDLVVSGEAAGLVTNPIHKAVMYQGGFTFPGHTEYLAHLLGVSGREVMMLACPHLRVVPVTIHMALSDAIASLRTEDIINVATITNAALQADFGIAHPRLAFSGLNPHAGEDGSMGKEEITIIKPALDKLYAMGVYVSGPLPADTMFHAAARQHYDVAVCMYHDQALIPIKTIGFEHAVNATLGLPIIRTSPDHGTAFNMAGYGIADPSSLMAALRMAAEMAAHRQQIRSS